MGLKLKEEKVVGFEDGEEELKPKKRKGPKKTSGGFESMGLSFPVLKAIKKRGYKIPTPIQRKTIPVVLEGRDVVAMARTGSGKTACFLVPMFEKLKTHTGHLRALLLSPTRELALQTYRMAKDLGKQSGLVSCLVVGGDSMEGQFSTVHSNKPDLAVATPGRFLHLCVEMNLSLAHIEYVVFDEADRLYEMGFGEQMREILSRLPESRQTMLFSATLPKLLVDFARAGLSDPLLIRLDVDSKLPAGLTTHMVSCAQGEKVAALLCLLRQVISPKELTIVFAPTRHHVEYLHSLLKAAGTDSGCIYSELDPSARKISLAKFTTGKTKLLLVTDLAARGLDIPHLDNVVNFNFPDKPKLFVHRVGRCARAGRSGTAYSLVSSDELCYLLDLQLFLGRPLSPLLAGQLAESCPPSATLLARVPRRLVESYQSQVLNLHSNNTDLDSQLTVSENGFKQFVRCRSGASIESLRRSKELKIGPLADHPLFGTQTSVEADTIVASIGTYRPPGTIFEIGQSSRSEMYAAMKKTRDRHKAVIAAHRHKQSEKIQPVKLGECKLEESCVEDLGSTFSRVITNSRRKKQEQFIPYRPSDHHSELGLGVKRRFEQEASEGGLEVGGDTEAALRRGRDAERKRSRKGGPTADGGPVKKVRSESGAWIPASYKSGRYATWLNKTKKSHIAEAEVEGESEEQSVGGGRGSSRVETRWAKHNAKVSSKKVKSELKRPEQILKERLRLEKKKLRNGRKKKKTKKN